MMAKKRRLDRKRDKSSGQRIAQFGKAALTVGVGVALFSRARLDKSILGEMIPAVSQTAKNISKDMAGKKTTAMNIHNALKRNIGKNGEVFNRTIKEIQKNKKYRIDTSRANNIIGKFRNIDQVVDNELYERLNAQFDQNTFDDIVKRMAEEYKDKYSKESLEQFIEGIKSSENLKYVQESLEKNELDLSFLEETMKTLKINEKDARIITETTAKTYLKREGQRQEYLDIFEKAEETYKKLAKESVAKKTRQNTLLNRIGKRLGIDNLDELFLGSRAATLDDVFGDPERTKQILGDVKASDFDDKIYNARTRKTRRHNSYDEVERLYHKGELSGDTIFDSRLRVKTNKDGTMEIFDLTESMALFDSLIKKFNSTLPGKILTKGIDIQTIRDAPIISFHRSGFKSIMSRYDDDAVNNVTTSFKATIGNTLFRMDQETGELTELAQGMTVGLTHGTFSGVIRRMLGSDRVEPLASKGWLARTLDFNQDGKSNFINRFKQYFTKFTDENWQRNILDRQQEIIMSEGEIEDRVKYVSEQLKTSKSEAIRRMHEDNKLINELYRKKAAGTQLSQDTVASVLEVVNTLINKYEELGQDVSDHLIRSQNLLELILNQDVDASFKYLTEEMNFKTEGLNNLIHSYLRNSDETLKRIWIESGTTKKIPILDLELGETNVLNIQGILKTEMLKEIFSEEEITSASLELIGGLNQQQSSAIFNLYNWQNFENATMANHNFSSRVASLYFNGSDLDKFYQSLNKSPDIKGMVLTDLENMKKDFGLLHKGNVGNPNEMYESEYDVYEFVPKSNWGMDLITGENRKTKLKAALKEFNGGRDNVESISMATIITQYMVNRLSMGVEDSGLGLSYKSLSSPLNAMASILTKRVLPTMMAYTAFDYLNDLSQDLTGVGITGAAANSIANLDIAGRKLLYNIGIGDMNLGQAIDDFKTTSVMGEYLTGSTEFQTAEERREWYADGYSPVRKSRFWSFGSASEFRGGDITFFQPNYLRRIHSDYRDEWLYGGNKEKWKHSFIPTPTHPFSTIRYLMDPYWLEKKHMDDAPTPLTGKMFSEGTPWGAILNPTIGEVIKPQIMLPEVRKRLTGKGHDSRALLKSINERTKERARRKEGKASNDDLLVINGTDIRNATYVPYGAPTDSELIITNGQAKGLNYMDGLSNVGEYQVPKFTEPVVGPGGQQYGGGNYVFANRFTRAIHAAGSDFMGEVFAENNSIGEGIVANINASIKRRAMDKAGYGTVNSSSPDSTAEGTYVYNNLINQYNTRMMDYYENKYTHELVDKNIAMDHLRDAKHSVKQLSGIYGFLADTAFGSDEFTFRYENAGSYTSFTKGFWDAGLGGLGGGPMEIARRFFPSSDKSRVDYNPLRNNVADWLPDYLQIGNPFSKLTKGEMRLPGKGYESLNELHPDEYATDGYGSFDRFKILADVAPNSQEYKIWHNIVKHNTTDPELLEEIKEIEARTKRMRGAHEFYEYQYLHTNTKYETGVVKEITNDGKIILVNDQILTMAGIKFNEKYGGELNEFVTPGQKITYRTTDNVINDHEQGVIRNAAIFSGTENVNKALMDMGVADRDHMDTSAIGQLSTVSAKQEFFGMVQEAIAHARIPLFHNKLMHVETALESYRSEQVYGANFQTWDHPIKGILKPMWNETMGQSMLRRVAAHAYGEFHFNKVMKGDHRWITKFASGTVLATLDPMAMMGGTLNWGIRLHNGRTGSGNQVLGAWSTGAKYGNIIGTVAWGLANADNPIKAAGSFALAGMELFNKLEVGEYASKVLGKNIDIKGAALIGTGIGLGISAIKNSHFDKDKMFGKWQPEDFKKKVALDEYFDRLEYVKYKGLYEAAASKALFHEKTNIKAIFKDIDKNKKRIEKLKKQRKKLLTKYDENESAYKSRAAKIDAEIEALTQRGNQMFVGGKYTKAAVAYKKAMESTIYGLSAGATKDEILAAVPDQYKDYFQAFMDVTDESEREKILKEVPDYLKRPLQAAWGMELEDVKSNRRYFKNHKLPGVGWRGWKPNINLKHVKMKTIQNEGMLLSDFGFYESEKAKAAYEIAPDIDNYDSRSVGFNSTLRLKAEMKGLGVRLSNVSIEKTSAPGFWITADMKQSLEERAEYGANSIHNGIQSFVANFI